MWQEQAQQRLSFLAWKAPMTMFLVVPSSLPGDGLFRVIVGNCPASDQGEDPTRLRANLDCHSSSSTPSFPHLPTHCWGPLGLCTTVPPFLVGLLLRCAPASVSVLVPSANTKEDVCFLIFQSGVKQIKKWALSYRVCQNVKQ